MVVEALEIFYSYAHEDEKLREELEKHLSVLKRQGVITGWHDRKISAGQEWKGQIDAHLNSAQIILLLVSADFLASDYCYDVEMKRALERHEWGEACVIPIILRSVDWHDAPFGKLQCLPTDALPVTRWEDRDEAFKNIATGIRTTVETMRQQKQGEAGGGLRLGSANDKRVDMAIVLPGKGQGAGFVARVWSWLTETNMNKLTFIGGFIAVITVGGWTAYTYFFPPDNKPILLIPDTAIEQINKGNKLLNIGRYTEAKEAFQQALKIHPQNDQAAWGLRKAMAWDLHDATFEQEIRDLYQKDPKDAHVNLFWGIFHAANHDVKKAIPYYRQAAQLNPQLAEAHFGLGVLSDQLGQIEAAKEAYVKAVEISQSTAKYRNNLAYLYFKQHDYRTAIEEYGRISNYPLADLEIAKSYWFLGDLERALTSQKQALHRLNDATIMAQPENQDPWYFETGDEGIELNSLDEKKWYATYAQAVTFYLLRRSKDATALINQAKKLQVPHEKDFKDIFTFELKRLVSEQPKFSTQIRSIVKSF